MSFSYFVLRSAKSFFACASLLSLFVGTALRASIPARNAASASAVVLFGIILVLTFVQRKLTGRKDG